MLKCARIIAAVFAAAAFAAFAGEPSEFNQTERDFSRDRVKSFALRAKKIAADSPYTPWLEYRRAGFALRRNKPEKLEHLRLHSVSPYVRRRAARDLAEYYLRAQKPQQFAEVADVSPCGALLLRLRRGDGGREELLAAWDDEQKFQDNLCIAAYRRARADGVLSEEDIWIKFRGLAGSGMLAATRRFLRTFNLGISYRDVRKTVLRAARYIRGKHALSSRRQRELVMIAAMAAARKHPETAVRRWRAFSQYFSTSENAQVWAKIAERAARAHRPDAMDLYRLAPLSAHDGNARAWRVRAALRAGDYADIVRTIQRMPAAQAALSAWRYWRAAALSHTGNKTESRAQMRALAADTDDYYGLLAREELGAPPAAAPQTPPPAAAKGDFAMALAVRRAGLERLARKIWKDAAQQSGEEETLAAARVAENEEWYLASINAANLSDSPRAHAIRYPFPYRETIDKYINKFGLDPAFVYALIRRESRFMPKAISSAKARGLMQVLPSTARKVARSHGYGRYRLPRLVRVDTNVIIGVSYLHDLARRFNAHPVHVAAAYNAGPGRAARWRRGISDTLVLVENIPFLETRLYVKALLAARAHYGARLGLPPRPMRALADLAITAAAAASESD